MGYKYEMDRCRKRNARKKELGTQPLEVRGQDAWKERISSLAPKQASPIPLFILAPLVPGPVLLGI